MKETPIANMDGEMVRLAYEESLAVQKTLYERMHALDRKALAIFGFASVALSLSPGLIPADFDALRSPPTIVAVACLLAALLAWAVGAGLTAAALYGREGLVSPNPLVLQAPDWTCLTETEFRFHRLEDIGNVYKQLLARCNKRARFTNYLLWCVCVEAATLTVALGLLRLVG